MYLIVGIVRLLIVIMQDHIKNERERKKEQEKERKKERKKERRK